MNDMKIYDDWESSLNGFHVFINGMYFAACVLVFITSLPIVTPLTCAVLKKASMSAVDCTAAWSALPGLKVVLGNDDFCVAFQLSWA